MIKSLILIFIILPYSLLAQEMEIIPGTLPNVYNLLFINFQNDYQFMVTNTSNKPLDHWINSTEKLFSKIPSNMLFKIINTEFEKTILSVKNPDLPPSSLTLEYIDRVQKFIKNHQKFFHPLETYVFTNLYYDLNNLYHDSLYKTYHYKIQRGEVFQKQSLRLFQKKMNRLLQCVDYLLFLENIERQTLFKQWSSKIISNINIKLSLLTQFATLPNVSNSTHFFRKKVEVNIANIVDNALKDAPPKKEVPATSINYEELPPLPTPIPGYTPPKELPKPINDWFSSQEIPHNDNLIVIPTPDPNYLPPDDLPIPLGEPGIWPEE